MRATHPPRSLSTLDDENAYRIGVIGWIAGQAKRRPSLKRLGLAGPDE
jgi:hypothetical protein